MTDVAHPIRFGAVMSIRGAARRWAEAAREVEGAGYSSFLVPDTLFAPSPFPTLAAAAASTSTLRLGTWALESLRDGSGISYFTVPGEVALRLAPLVAALSGR